MGWKFEDVQRSNAGRPDLFSSLSFYLRRKDVRANLIAGNGGGMKGEVESVRGKVEEFAVVCFDRGEEGAGGVVGNLVVWVDPFGVDGMASVNEDEFSSQGADDVVPF